MAVVRVSCAFCGKPVDKDAREYNRSLKKGRPFYCNLRCASSARNASKRAQEVICVCPCGKRFVTTTKAKAAEHCSRSCASRFSMNAERREAQRVGGLQQAENLLEPAEALKRREAWKYVALREVLAARPHEFEYELEGYVFDLALLDVHVLVEFDGPYHTGTQLDADRCKEEVARRNGFLVVRRTVQAAVMLDPNTITGL